MATARRPPPRAWSARSPRAPRGARNACGIGSPWVHLQALPDLRPRRLLRLLAEQARPRATPLPTAIRSWQSLEPGEDWRWCYVHEALV